MAIIEALDYLKCKLLSDTFRYAALGWYTGLPRLSITKHKDLVKKLVHQFVMRRHRNMTTTSLLKISQRPSESLKEHFTHFNEAKFKVIHSNQEMFGLKA